MSVTMLAKVLESVAVERLSHLTRRIPSFRRACSEARKRHSTLQALTLLPKKIHDAGVTEKALSLSYHRGYSYLDRDFLLSHSTLGKPRLLGVKVATDRQT